jgi:flagellar protein FlgJ
MGDVRGLEALRGRAARDPQGAVREAARQFEALFMQELMKSMRATTQDSGLMDGGAGEDMATSLLDQQYAGQLTGLRGGLADAIARQLERQMGLAPGGGVPATPPSTRPSAIGRPAPRPAHTAQAGPERAPRIPEHGAAAFVQTHMAAARRAEAATGIPAGFMVAQAAHESGWGRREILHADGSPSHNLFGIKAGAGWTGPVAEVTTTEFVDGQPRKLKARFRAYASHAESFADYARLMKDSPRYRDVLGADNAQDFARGLQRAGYATDPAYADKLTRTINTTLRLQRSQS